MNLPTITEASVDGASVQTVNGRDVHRFLEIRKDFTDWIKVQIDRARLREGRDYVSEVSPQKGENPSAQICTVVDQGVSRGGRPRTEYHLTVDAAKHIGMMSGTERGFELREYFLACERRAKAQVAPSVPQTLPEALRLAADLAEANARQTERIAVLEPQAAALTTLAETEGTFCIRDAAKALGEPEKALRDYLKRYGWIYRRAPNEPWVARADRLAAGMMRTKVIPVETGTGKTWNRPQARITSRGLAFLAVRLGKPVPPEAQQPLPLALAAPARA